MTNKSDEDTGRKQRDTTVQFSDRAIKFIVYFTIASGVPAFVGIVVGVQDENALVAIGACIAMLIVDLVMMFAVRKRETQRQQMDAGEATANRIRGAKVERSSIMLASSGIVLNIVCVYSILANVIDPWLRAATGVMSAALLLVAGYRERRRVDGK